MFLPEAPHPLIHALLKCLYHHYPLQVHRMQQEVHYDKCMLCHKMYLRVLRRKKKIFRKQGWRGAFDMLSG